jgi:hypothetical protein
MDLPDLPSFQGAGDGADSDLEDAGVEECDKIKLQAKESYDKTVVEAKDDRDRVMEDINM